MDKGLYCLFLEEELYSDSCPDLYSLVHGTAVLMMSYTAEDTEGIGNMSRIRSYTSLLTYWDDLSSFLFSHDSRCLFSYWCTVYVRLVQWDVLYVPLDAWVPLWDGNVFLCLRSFFHPQLLIQARPSGRLWHRLHSLPVLFLIWTMITHGNSKHLPNEVNCKFRNRLNHFSFHFRKCSWPPKKHLNIFSGEVPSRMTAL